MPKKIRELKQMLSQVGFTEVPGKGSHTNWVHPHYSGKITISGKDGADAKRYQEKEVK
ncbi:type II toxin-antitoxin system HicA family toxin [Nostoc sp.]|uniref:type II toxin-antitoxin system HicA family toxin n=1 Tax=Nostoc sp. TaxID=1180 RepID=UPI002FFB9499